MLILIILIMQKKIDISNELYQYAINVSVREHTVLQQLRVETAKLTNAVMQTPQYQAQFMGLLAKMTNAKRYLEIGVFTGYSALAMTLAMGSKGQTIALDNNKDYLKIAHTFWELAGVNNNIQVIEGNALESCKQLLESGHENFFDIAFIDANKTGYLNYYEYCYQLVRPGGLILIDNVLFFGEVLKDKPSNSARAIKQLNDFVYQDPRVEISLLPIADGLTIAYKKELI